MKFYYPGTDLGLFGSSSGLGRVQKKWVAVWTEAISSFFVYIVKKLGKLPRYIYGPANAYGSGGGQDFSGEGGGKTNVK